jgi:hypothetical protein
VTAHVVLGGEPLQRTRASQFERKIDDALVRTE